MIDFIAANKFEVFEALFSEGDAETPDEASIEWETPRSPEDLRRLMMEWGSPE